jgi:hypothetical protein
MHSEGFRACAAIFVLALACAVVAGPANARTDFEGDWEHSHRYPRQSLRSRLSLWRADRQRNGHQRR